MILGIFLFLAAICDFVSYKVSNRLIFFFYACGLIYQVFWGESSVFFYALSALLLLLLGIPLFKLHIIGGADVKLFGITALFTGIWRALHIACISFLLGAAFAVFLLLWHFLRLYRSYRREKPELSYFQYLKKHPTRKMHFSVMIFAAYLAEELLFRYV